MVNINEIKKFFCGYFALSEPLSKYTSYCIGGPADYFLEPSDKEDAIQIVTYLQRQDFPFIILGKGSNLLVSDEGFRGAVIHFERALNSIRVEGDKVFADAGVSMAKFVDFCIQHGLKGVEMLAGIPGTIGGAILMNVGAYGGEISTHLVTVEVLRGGNIICLKKEEMGFAYRRSDFNGDTILGAGFQFPLGDKAALMSVRRELLIRRNKTQPLNFPNSGSIFKNPPGLFAAKLIEEAGLKGKRCGNAQISEKHANFIVNLGGAKADDVLALINMAKEKVIEKFDVMLELEVKLLGFPDTVMRELRSC